MLTLVLLVGAVSCSPVPSEPSGHHATSPPGILVEATQETQQVTFQVNEAVGETTLSSTSAEPSVDDDPPIPTATTPPVLPDSEHQDSNIAVTEPQHTPEEQYEASHYDRGSDLIIQPIHPHPPHSKDTPHHDSHKRTSPVTHHNSHPEVTEPHDSGSSDTPSHVTRTELIHSHPAETFTNPEEKSLENDKISDLNNESGKGNSSQMVSSKRDFIEELIPSQRTPSSQSPQHLHLSIKPLNNETSINIQNNKTNQQISDDMNNKFTGEISHNVGNHRRHHHHHHDEDSETVVEADGPWEHNPHRHFGGTFVGNTDDGNTGDSTLARSGNVVVRVNNSTLSLGGTDIAIEKVIDKNNDTKAERLEHSGTTDNKQETTAENIAEERQRMPNIWVTLAERRVQDPLETTRNNTNPSEESNIESVAEGSSNFQNKEEESNIESKAEGSSNSQNKEEVFENLETESGGEKETAPVITNNGNSSPIQIVERSGVAVAEGEVLKEAPSETVFDAVPQGTPAAPEAAPSEDTESRRGSRVYAKSDTEAKIRNTDDLDDQKRGETGSESESVTSPSSDGPQEAPTQVPEEPEATISPPLLSDESENITVMEYEDSVDGNGSTALNPSVAPQPVEDYTDNYSVSISTDNLPDHIERPQTDLPLLSTSDKEASGNFRKQGGVAWALPPQQEQVSVVAPESLTTGCIVAIVFGVIISVMVVMGIGGFVVWHRRPLNRPKVLGSDRGYAGSDSGGYIDDQVRVSYVNSQIDSPKGSPEDLISLDNDSFLNSLESMTIQNLWTDSIRHTKL